MKPFDLEAFKNGAIALDSTGAEVRYVGRDSKNRIAFEYLDGSFGCCAESWVISCWKMKQTRKTVYLNVYSHFGKSTPGSKFYSTEADATLAGGRHNPYLYTIPIEIEE